MQVGCGFVEGESTEYCLYS